MTRWPKVCSRTTGNAMGRGKLDLYAIGQGGVNVVKAPVDLDRDEAVLLQNVIYPSLSGEGGLQKRGGLQRKNPTALNGGADILGMADVPLPDPFSSGRQYLYVGMATDNWARTADGVTWVDQATPGFPGRFQQLGTPILGLPPIQPLQGRFLYVSGNTDLDDFWLFDGSSDQLVLVVPPVGDPTIPAYTAGASGFHLGDFYFGTITVTNPRVYKFDLTTGALTMIGGGVIGSQYTAMAIGSYLGQLFVAASDNSAGVAPNSFVYRCDPLTATAWTLDSALLDGIPGGMVNFQGNLYIATGSRNAAKAMTIYKRTPSGIYSTVFTDATPWNIQSGGAIIEFNDTLFAYMGGNIVKSTDGTVWTVDLDVFTTYGSFEAKTGLPVIFNNELYWPFEDHAEVTSRVLKRTAAGVWSVSYLFAGDLGAILTIFEVP